MKIGLYHLISEINNEAYIDSTLKSFMFKIEEKLAEKI